MTKTQRLNRRLMKKKDVEFSLYIRNRDKRCLWCGKTDKKKLQCAHIISRTVIKYRWDKNNAITLCGGCHLFKWHKGNPLVTALWFSTTYPEIYNWWFEANEKLNVDKEEKTK